MCLLHLAVALLSLAAADVAQHPSPRCDRKGSEGSGCEAARTKGVSLLQSDTTRKLSYGSSAPAAATRTTLPSGMLQACTKIYLDMGSNMGVQVRKLFEPEHYPGAEVLPIFDRFFGLPAERRRPSNESGLCAVGFEASPEWAGRLQRVEKAYKDAKGWSASFVVPAAVSDRDNETVTFHYGNNWGPYQDVWAGIATEYKQAPKATKVPTLDMAAFVAEQIVPLSSKNVTVVGKVDIEGSEYVILPKLLKEGLLCAGTIDVLFIEFHEQKPAGYEQYSPEALKAQISKGEHCAGRSPTQIIDLDDESFGADGAPLPGESS
mmetsp:Transcript_46795/g.135379  ORF Transcript_46795/g.135379 Transcript_46795/m.135379 type:complete len:320 (-) Transcript_46795:106-1065(-)